MKEENKYYVSWPVRKKSVFLIILLLFTSIFYFFSFSAKPFGEMVFCAEFSYVKLITETWSCHFVTEANIGLALKLFIIPTAGFLWWWIKPTKPRLCFAMLVLIFYWWWYLSDCFGGPFGYREYLREYPQNAHVVPWWIRHIANSQLWWGGR